MIRILAILGILAALIIGFYHGRSYQVHESQIRYTKIINECADAYVKDVEYLLTELDKCRGKNESMQ